MKAFFIFMALFSLQAFASQKILMKSNRAKLTCSFRDVGKVSFVINLNKGTAKEIDEKDADIGFTYKEAWFVDSHVKKNGKGIQLTAFNRKDMGKADINLLTLTADNNDDTDYTLVVSYQDSCKDYPDTCREPIAVQATLLTYVDSGVSDTDVEVAKDCSFKLIK